MDVVFTDNVQLNDNTIVQVDYSSTEPLPLAQMALSSMEAAYNQMCAIGVELGMGEDRCKPVHKFKDRVAGERRLAGMHAAIRLAITQNAARAEFAAEEGEASSSAAMSPGRTRLLNSGKAEEIRQNVLADQEKELPRMSEATREPAQKAKGKKKAPKAAKPVKVAKTAKAPKVVKAPKAAKPAKVNGDARVKYADKCTITLLHSGDNPKRGTAAERFAKYKDGMTFKAYKDRACEGNHGLASADVRWDSAKGWIRLNAAD